MSNVVLRRIIFTGLKSKSGFFILSMGSTVCGPKIDPPIFLEYFIKY